MNQLLTPEDSKRVADVLIAEIKNISPAVRAGITTGMKDVLGYEYSQSTQPFQRAVWEVKTAIIDALKRKKEQT